ncbi:MAG: S8 family serine peptidase, partial [Vicinamibacterales bacterium]|nr:S8 family serine peptidase [Vicinamibacterales bacterium]
MRKPLMFRGPSSVHPRMALLSLALAGMVCVGTATPVAAQPRRARLSSDLAARVGRDWQPTPVIIHGTEEQVRDLAARHGVAIRRHLPGGAVIDVQAGQLESVVNDAALDNASLDATVHSTMDVTVVSTGANQVWSGEWRRSGGGDYRGISATGRSVTVAVIDSGIDAVPQLSRRILANVNFTDSASSGDDYGHGTHIAGIIGASRNSSDFANFYDRDGSDDDRDDADRDDAEGLDRSIASSAGIAPDVKLVNLKVLGADGTGRVSDVIRAIDWAIQYRNQFRIKVINLSLGHLATESWRTDPLTQAVERAYRAGIFVVASAGNRGKLPDGRKVYGLIDSPGTSPYAFTVGALNTKGTPQRSDDVVTTYSSRGPTWIDRLPKPDAVAPGNKIRSLLGVGTTLASEHPEFIVGAGAGARLELSGTSMSAAVVSGAAAVLLEGNRLLTPFGLRVALQYTS